MTTAFKDSELGPIPEAWECRKIRDAASKTANAIVGGPFGSDLVSSEYVSSGIPVIRGQNMSEGLVAGEFVFVSLQKAKSLSANLARPFDLVFTQRGTLGQVSLVPVGAFDHYLISQSQMKVSLDQSRHDPSFVQQYFLSAAGQKQILGSAIQTGVPHTNLGILRAYNFPAPPLTEQKAIAAALSDVDGLLGALDRLIAKKRDLKQAAMQQLLTGQTRLPGFVSKPGNKQSDVGVIPKDWEAAKIESIIDEISMGPFGSDITVSNFVTAGVPVLSGANVASERLNDDFHNYVSLEKAKSLKKAVARRGDVVVTHRGTIGQISYIPDESAFDRYVVSQSQFRVRFLKDAVIPAWVVLYFHSELGSRRLLEGKGHTGVPAIAQPTKTFRNLSIPLPPLSEQTAIVQVLSDMDAEQTALGQRRDKTRLLKQGMMQELLTGRTRLV